MKWLYFVIIQVVAIEFGGVTADIKTYYLDSDLCNQTMVMKNYKSTDVHTFLMKLTAEEHYPHNLHCFFTAKVQNSEHIMFHFRTFSVHGEAGVCSDDWLELHDGNSLAAPYVFGTYGKLCGPFQGVKKSGFITENHTLTLYFQSGVEESYPGFETVITRFRYNDVPCRPDEFECSNGRCIDKGIKCNGYNPCGDSSDCKEEKPEKSCVGETAAYIVLAIIVVILVAVIVMFILRFYYDKNVPCCRKPGYDNIPGRN